MTALFAFLAALLSGDIEPALISALHIHGALDQPGTGNLIDYDTDDDGLIDVGSLAMLNAIRWDLDGNGVSTNTGYSSAFPTPQAGMGCPASVCSGYELTTDLDFDTNNDGVIDSNDDWWNSSSGWLPIGDNSSDTDTTRFNATFDGNGHTITNLYISRISTLPVGLFGALGSSSVVQRLGLTDVSVSGHTSVAALAGYSAGQIEICYSTGAVNGTRTQIGGLVGQNEGSITASYSSADVTGIGSSRGSSTTIGGLVGVSEKGSTITASYSTGVVSGAGGESIEVGGLVGISRGDIEASFSTSRVSAVAYVGGLIGDKGSGTITDSYWDTETSGRAVGVGSDDLDFDGTLDPGETPTEGVTGKTTAELRSPTDYTGIYSSWNISIDADSTADDPWDFGANYNYPVLKVDFDGDSSTDPNWTEFGLQREPGPVGSLAETLNNDGTIQVGWNAPTDTGSDTSVDYQYRSSADGGTTWSAGWTTTSSTSYTFTPALNTAYTIDVRATSSAAHHVGRASRITTTAVTTPPAPTDATLSIVGSGTSVAEGSSISINVTLNRSAPTGGASVRWYVAAGTTTPKGSATGDLTITGSPDNESRYRAAIATGDKTATISISASDDARLEHDTEYIRFIVDKVVLGGDETDNFTPTTGALEFGINDTDTITLGLSAQTSVSEGTSGTVSPGSSQVTVSATANPSTTLDRSVKVKVVSDGGTASTGDDYTAFDETVTFSAGTVVGTGTGDSPSATSTTPNPFQPIADSTAEKDETVVLKLADLSTADRAYSLGISPPTSTITIRDDDRATAVSSMAADPGSIDEDTEESTTITITLDGDALSPATFNWTITGQGIQTGDFTLVAGTGDSLTTTGDGLRGTLTVGAGKSSAPLTLAAVDDAANPAPESETLTFTLSSVPGGLSVPDNTSVSLTITDNDPVAVSGSASLSLWHRNSQLNQSSSFVAEGDIVKAQVTLSQSQVVDVQIPLSLPSGNDITADLTGTSQTTPSIAITSGQTTGSVSFLVQLDQVNENDETATIGLGTPTYGTTRPVSGSITTGSTGDLKINDLLVSSQTRIVSAVSRKQKLRTTTINTGRNLASGDGNQVAVTFRVSTGDFTAAWQIQGQTGDLTDTLNGDGTRTFTLTTGDIAGRSIVLGLYVTPSPGASDPFSPQISVTSIVIKDNNLSKELIPAALAPNRAPNAPSLSSQTATEDQAFTYRFAEATDPDGDMVSYAAGTGDRGAFPSWLSFDAGSRTFSGTPLEDDTPGSHTIRVTVSDASLSTSSTFSLTVAEVNDPPSAPSLTDQAATEDEAFSYTFPAVTDPEESTVTYSAELEDGSSLPTWLTFSTSSRTFSGTPREADVGTLSIKVTASDGAASNPGSASSTFTITIVSPIDYDTDDDGLIDVDTLNKLNAIRWDLDGNGASNGASTDAGYATAFPTPRPKMGCPSTGCQGYELTTDLDFDTNGNAAIDSGDAWWNSGLGWLPIGDGSSNTDATRFNGIFEGNGHSIENLFIKRDTSLVGLFGASGSSSVVQRLSLADVSVSGHSSVAALAGYSAGQIETCYSTGAVQGTGDRVGGLVGQNDGSITASYSSADVTGGGDNVGGLAGSSSTGSSITASYSTGSASATGSESGQVGGLVGTNGGSILASYSTATAYGLSDVGGLIGYIETTPKAKVADSYWDAEASGLSVGVGSDDTDSSGALGPGETPTEGVTGKTTTELRSPTGYGTGDSIYASWNIDLDDADGDQDRDTGRDDPWDFGANYNYPVLKVDFDGDSSTAANWTEFGLQREPGPLGALSETLNNDGTIQVAWTAPTDTGSDTSVGYQYRASADGGTTWSTGWTATSSTSYTFTPALSTAYTVDVRATSSAAHSAGKASRITTTPIFPDPTNATLAIVGNSTSVAEGSSISISVTLNQPAPTGGASVRWYVADGTTSPKGSATGDLAITGSPDSESRYRAAIATGDRTATISIPTSDDTRVEHDTEYIRFIVDKVVLGGDETDNFTPTTGALEFGINDTDTITLGLSAQSPIKEGTAGISQAGTSQVTVSATANPAATLDRSVKVRVVSDGGTASTGDDYTAFDETVTFNAGTVIGTGTGDSPAATATTANPLRAIVDSVFEADETVVLKLADLSTADRAYNLGVSPPTSTITILDDDGPPVISAFSIDNTNPMLENGGVRTFTVTLTNAANSALSIPVSVTLDGGVTAGKLTFSCTHAQKACVSIGSGQISGTLTISSTGDDLITGAQPVKATLKPPEGVTLAEGVNSAISVDRLDDDLLTATLTKSSYSVNEGQNLQVTVKVTAPNKNLVRTASLQLQTSASNPVSAGTGDYTALDHTIQLQTGDYTTSGRSLNVSISTTGDDLAELDETFEVTLSTGDSLVSLAGQTTSATITILDDDRATSISELSASPASIDEDAGETSTITITLDGVTRSAALFDWAVSGQGIDTGDFTLVAGTGASLTATGDGLRGTVTVQSGRSTASLTLTAVDDADDPQPESETLTFTLTSVSGGLAVPDNTTAEIAITDNDPVAVSGTASLSLWHGDTEIDQQTSFVAEGDIVKAQVTLSGPLAVGIQLPLSLPVGNDLTGDLTGASQTSPKVTIPAGQTTGWTSILARLDQVDESDETVTIGLGTPIYGTTRPVTGSITTESTGDLKINDVLVSNRTRNVTAGGGKQKLRTVTIDTGRSLASGDGNEVAVTFSVSTGDFTTAWRIQGQTGDLVDTLNVDGTRTITLTTGDITGRSIVLDLYVTPGTGSTSPFQPAISVTSITVQDNDISKELIPGALAPNLAPNAPSLSAQTATEDESFTYQFAEVVDPDGDMVTYAANSGDMDSLPAWLSFDAGSRIFTGTPLEADSPNSYTIRVTVSDASLSTSSAFTLTVEEVNDPPSALSLTDQFAEVDKAFSYIFTAVTDPEGSTIIYSAELKDGSSLPDWLTFDESTRTFSGTPGESDVGSLTIKVTASDGADPTPGTASSTFTITIASPIDYDTDDDSLIDVDTLAKLDAIRWDLDGDGAATDAGYSIAFPTPQAGMGCPSAGCRGYELTADLDFDTNNDGVIGPGDDWWDIGDGWIPSGDGSSDTDATRFTATFDGRGHTIANLFISRTRTHYVGLFGSVGSSGDIRNLALTDINVTGQTGVGGLVGGNQGRITAVYTTGTISTSSHYAGGLVGWNNGGTIAASYSSTTVSGNTQVGGLVGLQSSGSILASYFTGAVSAAGGQAGGLIGDNRGSVIGSYSTGTVSGPIHVGGLIGINQDGVVTNSYWDTETSGMSVGIGSDGTDDSKTVEATEPVPPGVSGKTDAELRAPTNYTGIYYSWNISIDGDSTGDDPWDFGASYNYPVLKVDLDGVPGTDPSWQEFGRQREPGPVSSLSASLRESGNIETTWNEPSDKGSGTLGSYRYRVSYDGGKTWAAWTNTESTSYTINGSDDAVHSFEVRATSDAVHRLGAASRLGPPAPPDSLSLTTGDAHLVATWDSAEMNGGAAVTAYHLQHRRGTTGDWTHMSLSSETRTVTLDSLTNNQPYQVRIAAENMFGMGAYSLPRTASPVNSPPPAPPVVDQTATELQVFSYTFDDVSDRDEHAVSFSAAPADGGQMPSWLTFDATSRTFSGTPQDADTGPLPIKVTATDDGTPPASSEASFTLTVEDVNQPPAPFSIDDMTAGAGLFLNRRISKTTDPDSKDDLSYSATLKDGGELPIWLGSRSKNLSLAAHLNLGTPVGSTSW